MQAKAIDAEYHVGDKVKAGAVVVKDGAVAAYEKVSVFMVKLVTLVNEGFDPYIIYFRQSRLMKNIKSLTNSKLGQ